MHNKWNFLCTHITWIKKNEQNRNFLSIFKKVNRSLITFSTENEQFENNFSLFLCEMNQMRIDIIWFKLNINSTICHVPNHACGDALLWHHHCEWCLFTIDSANEHVVHELTHICRWMIKWISHSSRMISSAEEFRGTEKKESKSIWNANRRNYKIRWNVGGLFCVWKYGKSRKIVQTNHD